MDISSEFESQMLDAVEVASNSNNEEHNNYRTKIDDSMQISNVTDSNIVKIDNTEINIEEFIKINNVLTWINRGKYNGIKVEKILKKERPLVKRFVSQAYDGEYGELPLRVADIVADYIKESV